MNRLMIILALSTLGVTAAELPAQRSQKNATEVVATAGEISVTAAELSERLGNRLFMKQTEEFALKEEVLQELIGAKLVEREAARRKTGPAQLLAAEVDAKVAPVSEAEKKATYENVKERTKGRPEADVMKDIERELRQQKVAARHAQFVGELRARNPVRILLDPPRLKVDVADGAAKGPASAPVTILEFSDFQCPYCSRVVPTFKTLQQTYPQQVRIVFRHFPLGFHQHAAKAAEAAECAREQGKFWEMHDKLFETQANLAVPELKKRATDLGLSATTFGQCLDSGRHAARVAKDAAAAAQYAVSATPAFFVNGRFVSGAQPYERFAQIVQQELDLRARKPAPVKGQ